MTQVMAQAMRDHAADDHERGCLGRQYTCTCGYDAATEALLTGAADCLSSLECALRDAFPHFQNDEPVTPDAIRRIGREYQDMVMRGRE